MSGVISWTVLAVAGWAVALAATGGWDAWLRRDGRAAVLARVAGGAGRACPGAAARGALAVVKAVGPVLVMVPSRAGRVGVAVLSDWRLAFSGCSESATVTAR